MEIKEHNVNIYKKKAVLKLTHFTDKDKKLWKESFDAWLKLKDKLSELNSRASNLPEGISEIAFCLYSGSTRFVSSKTSGLNKSFDTFNLKRGRAEQIKATTIENDLTSFGPKSKWDDLYLMDFYNKGKLDGSFNLYKVSTKLIHKVVVKKKGSVTFIQRQKEGKRPRFSITKELIETGKIKPIATNVKVWE